MQFDQPLGFKARQEGLNLGRELTGSVLEGGFQFGDDVRLVAAAVDQFPDGCGSAVQYHRLGRVQVEQGYPAGGFGAYFCDEGAVAVDHG